MCLMEEPQHARVVALRDRAELGEPRGFERVGALAGDPVGLVEEKHSSMLWS